MKKIYYKDRKTGQIQAELVYGEKILSLLYADNPLSHFLAQVSSRVSLISKCYGAFQKLPITRKKIACFVKKYHIDVTEFADSDFPSFNDFFIRKLKPQARPLSLKPAIIPADGRFLFYQEIHKKDGFVIKGKKFCLTKLLGNAQLAQEFQEGSMVIARLCPSDYHRFHFPCRGKPGPSHLINGPLYSVNPISIRKNISLLSENKRMITLIDTIDFGKMIYVEIGATNVGSIHQTFTPYQLYEKGDEKGFFSFGGSSLILLFLPQKIIFDDDLIKASEEHLEMRCLMGQSLGKIYNTSL